jgi:uncharacterized protein (DUF2236 family)
VDVVSVSNWVSETPDRLRQRFNRAIREAAGLSHEPPTACVNPDEAFLPVDGVARIVNGDLAPMMIGGLASLFFEMLHPHTMAGVAQHSRYEHDALGRVRQTANFIGHTTFGSRADAHRAIERVLAIHQGVRGVADDGHPYFANDPHLLQWVHCAGTSMFLSAYQHYGALDLSRADCDRYVAEVATTARLLGVPRPPTTVDELDATLESFRPELRLSADGVTARDFVARGVVTAVHQRLAYRVIVDAAYALLKPWARELLGVPTKPVHNRLVARPAASALATAVRFAVPPTKPITSR